MCAQNINNPNLGDAENKVYNHMNTSSSEKASRKTPFYFSTWMMPLGLIIWPFGLMMLWYYLSNKKQEGLPRTKNIKDDLTVL